MMTTPDKPTPTSALAPSNSVKPSAMVDTSTAELRLRLRVRGRDSRVARFVDGGWWPHTRDLTVELAPLLVAIEAAGYEPVRRVTYNLAAWDRPPRRVMVGGRLVKLGGFRTQDAAVVSLIGSSGWDRVDLVMLSPNTDPHAAESAITMAACDGDQHDAGEILQLANIDRIQGENVEDRASSPPAQP